MNGRLALLVPSRGRPAVLADLIDSFEKTHTPGLSDLIFRNGEDDPIWSEYLTYEDHPTIMRVLGSDKGFGWPTAGYCLAIEDLRHRFPHYSYYAMMEDDCLLLEKGWDAEVIRLINEDPQKLRVVHFTDVSNQIHAMATSAEWINAVGHFLAPELREKGFDGLLTLAKSMDAICDGPKIQHCPVPPSRGRAGFIYSGYKDIQQYWHEDVTAFNQWDCTPYQERLRQAREKK